MNIVITGSTKGIGLALTKKFLGYGDNVIISSRTQERINKVVETLKKEFPNYKIIGIRCDVSKYDEVEKLAQFAKEQLGKIDIWINNAGTNAYQLNNLVDFDPDTLRLIVETNLLGTLYGCKAALKIMIPQKSGKIFNFEGMGSNGMTSPQLIAYGATKASIPQLTKTLSKETKKTGIGVHTLSPGIVLTDLTLKNITPEAAKIFNILAERTPTVVDFLVPRARKIKGTNKRIKFLTNKKAFLRFMTAWKRKNRFFDEQGNLKEEIKELIKSESN